MLRDPTRTGRLTASLGIFVDLEIGLELAIRLEIPGFVGCVFVDNVRAVVLEIAKREEDDIAGYYPDLRGVSAEIGGE